MPAPRLALLVLLQPFNSPSSLPEELAMFEHFFVKWRLWSQPDCARFLASIVGCPADSPTLASLHCSGYSPRVQLYRALQVRGGPCTPGHRGCEATHPRPLRKISRGTEVISSPPAPGPRQTAHQARELCFWPVQVAKEGEETERMRRKVGLVKALLSINISFRYSRVWSLGPTPPGGTTLRPSWCSWRPGQTTSPWRRWRVECGGSVA